MAVNVIGSVTVSVSLQDQRTSVSGALNETGLRNIALSGVWGVTGGIGVGQADLCWSDVRTVGGGTSSPIDLTNVLNDAFGGVLNFGARVRAMVIVASPSNTTLLTVTRGAGGLPFINAAAGLATLSAGGFFALCDPLVGIPSGGADPASTFSVANSAGASAQYSVAIVGTSA